MFGVCQVDHGVRTSDGDGTVPLLSTGALCAKHWRERALNPSGLRVVSREYPHEPVALYKNLRWEHALRCCMVALSGPGTHLCGCTAGGVPRAPALPHGEWCLAHWLFLLGSQVSERCGGMHVQCSNT